MLITALNNVSQGNRKGEIVNDVIPDDLITICLFLVGTNHSCILQCAAILNLNILVI